MNYSLSVQQAKDMIVNELSLVFGVSPEEATYEHYYKAVALIVRDMMTKGNIECNAKNKKQGKKKVYYLCMEFLMGRSLKNNLYNLGLDKTMEEALSKLGIKLEKLYDQEPDAGLGNGGLGRLAACYLDGLATQGYPTMGYSIRYEYGIFKQKLIDGWQNELPDLWLPGGEVWLEENDEASIEVRFEGNLRDWWDGQYHHVEHENYKKIIAIPYDMMVPGKDGKGISVLRLWASESPGLDMALFNQGNYMQAIEQNAMAEVISKVLYPSDNHQEGKGLRLRQQYFLVSASIQDIIHRHLAENDSLDNLPDCAAIHINDTHPTLAIPEMMRILLDECGYEWDDAWNIVIKTVAYTNHTVMREALECWPEDLFKRLLPRIHEITKEIDNRFRSYVWNKTGDADKVERMAIISNGVVRMANLCVASCHSVNGVSELHSDILKKTVFKDFYDLMPEKFTNVTNGIAHRRWLCQANPGLSSFITELIGDGFVKNADELIKLRKYINDKSVLDQIEKIKYANKVSFAKRIEKLNGIKVDPSSIFDVQVKRMHEYKRQHLNALHIMTEYQKLKENPNMDYIPKTYIFGAKAAPGYFMAKKIISLICALVDLVNNDPDVNGKMKVVYMEDYNVTMAERLMPAADISEQISLAGTEASGTSNMKLMLNGAITLGTLDGANVEIHEAVGDENMFLFGMTAEQVEEKKKAVYNPNNYYVDDPVIRKAIDMMNSGICGKTFNEIASSLSKQDPYMVLADFEDYCRAQTEASKAWLDRDKWNRMSLMNISGAGRFAADRAVKEYAENIWKL